MALSPQAELVWQGRIHLGDEPGIHGNAAYSGLGVELPLTLDKTDPSAADTTTLVVRTRDVQTFQGYPGHLITVTAYVPDPGDPNHSVPTVLATERLTSADDNVKEVEVDLSGLAFPAFLGVRVAVDTEVPPGLYDDFLLVRLSNSAADFAFVATFGFRA
ncbi:MULTISPECIES: hypothetical protein [Saccharothrix]|uniref:hypothetical protein n=1 Tax=Saccharothrix TaxID=2071 RepID=UPI000A9ED828|nr:hypothetical protein [Saccharothrix sp. CB00851]